MPNQGRDAKGRFPPGVSGNPKGTNGYDHEVPVGDGAWANVLAGINDPRKDKRLGGRFAGGVNLDYHTIARMWEGDSITAKAIEAPAAEAFREGYELQIPNEGKYGTLKEDVETKLEELGVDSAVELAWNYKRAYGGSAILIGANDGRKLDQPLEFDRVKSLDYLNVFEPIEIVPDALYTDASKAKYGKPQFYRLNVSMQQIGESFESQQKSKKAARPAGGLTTRIHESRMVVFQGVKVSNYVHTHNPISQHWGISEVNRFYEALRDHGVGHSALSILPIDSAQPIISIEGLRDLIAKHPEKFYARMEALNLSRSNANAVLLDANKEKYERQTTNLQGIGDLTDRLSIYLAAVIGVPLSVLLGYVPASMGKPDVSEMTLWYNIVRSLQRRKLTPIIKPMVQMVMQSLRSRGIPKQYHLKWKSLETMTDPERAEMYLNQARTDSMNVKSGMATSNELRRSRFVGGFSLETQVDEDKEAPGFTAPLPAGVLPGSTPGPGGAAKPGAPGAPAAMGPNAHTVGGYARRNPTAPALGANPKEGGDVAPRARDAAQAVLDALETAGLLKDGARAFIDASDIVDEIASEDADGAGRQITFAGLPIVIENERGDVRTWVDTDGTQGQTRMRYAYGYIAGAAGADGDSVDVYLGPDSTAKWVYVIHQNKKGAPSDARWSEYDEDKCFLGFDSANHARDAYLNQYDDDRFFGGMSMISLEDFKAKLGAGTAGEAVTCATGDATP